MPLEVITGPMFSGKSTELVRRLKRAQLAGLEALLVRPNIDTTQLTHDGQIFPHMFVHNGIEQTFIDSVYDVIGIDEVQFFDAESLADILDLAEVKTVIVAGLDNDYRHEPFGIVPFLMAQAEKVLKLTAICVKCGAEATRTQRITNGQPAALDEPLVLVGEDDHYEARCADCWEIR